MSLTLASIILVLATSKQINRNILNSIDNYFEEEKCNREELLKKQQCLQPMNHKELLATEITDHFDDFANKL